MYRDLQPSTPKPVQHVFFPRVVTMTMRLGLFSVYYLSTYHKYGEYGQKYGWPTSPADCNVFAAFRTVL